MKLKNKTNVVTASENTNLFNIPNILTLFRMLLIPVFLLSYYQMPDKRYIAMLVFILASLTDCLDGYLARKLNQITSFGKLCDPLADKLMVLSMLFCLNYDCRLARWEWLNDLVLLLMLAKELLLVIGAVFMLKKGTVVYSNKWGKSATVSFCSAIVLVFPWHSSPVVLQIGQVLVLLAVMLSIIAFFSYLFSGIHAMRKK